MKNKTNLSIILFASLFAHSLLFSQNVEFKKQNFKDRADELKDAQKQIKEGDNLFEDGAYLPALEPYLKANEFNPNNVFLNYKIGVCYLHSSFKQKSLSYLEKAFKLNPTVGEDRKSVV